MDHTSCLVETKNQTFEVCKQSCFSSFAVMVSCPPAISMPHVSVHFGSISKFCYRDNEHSIVDFSFDLIQKCILTQLEWMHEIGAVMFNVVPSITFLDFLLATGATDTGECHHSLAEVKFPVSSSLVWCTSKQGRWARWCSNNYQATHNATGCSWHSIW